MYEGFLKKIYSIGNLGYILKLYFDFFGNLGNWNLIAKNICQFIELFIANVVYLNKKYIQKWILFRSNCRKNIKKI
jgi:hypothetical protein